MAGNFNHQSTADDVLEGINLQDKRVLVTGGASGIGAETVQAWQQAKGAEVIIAARNQLQAEEVQAAGAAATGNPEYQHRVPRLGLIGKGGCGGARISATL